MSEWAVAFGTADLTNCDREQIHIPGAIQPHGALLVLESDTLRVLQAGGDFASICGINLADILGKHLFEGTFAHILAPGDDDRLREVAASTEQSRPTLLRSFQYGDATVDIIVHENQGLLLLELEVRREVDPIDSLALVQGMVQRVQKAGSIEKTYQAIVDAVQGASDFDRVMLYRFLSDGAGSVEAEAIRPGIPSYLGLRYPASDIPVQARALYLRNWVRVIPDAKYTPSPLHLRPGAPAGAPIDLSICGLRSVSPIHLEYLANMGVVASMSLSIIVNGKLWGLIACHHSAPRFPTYRRRIAFELFAQMSSFQLETKIEAEDLSSRLRQKELGEALINSLSGEAELAEGLRRFQPQLLQYVGASGVGLWIDGQFSAEGKALKSDEAAQLVRWLNENMTEGVFHTNQLSSIYPPATGYADRVSGILALSISRSPRDYVIWFRPEIIHTVTWAGNPEKAIDTVSEATGRISPRSSFADWKQQVRMRSESWTSLDVRTANALRISLLEVVLEHTDQLARERERARIQQQALLAELDSRIAEWEKIAKELKIESDRRAIVEESLSQVLRRTVVEQEAERQRIARELHDSLGQYLTVMGLDLDGIGRDTQASTSIKQRVEKLKALTADIGHEVNHLAWEIRPTALDDLGLQNACQQFLEEWAERSTLKFDVHLTLSDRRLPLTIETTLYRVLQEAILNVVKHAKAERVGVILEAGENEVRLIVEDDGEGFAWDADEASTGPAARLGLLGIRERLALVRGLLEVESAPGSGTTLLIHVPLKE